MQCARGVITGQGSTLEGQAEHNITHTTFGALVGAGALVQGAASGQEPDNVVINGVMTASLVQYEIEATLEAHIMEAVLETYTIEASL